jgi:hypothetical protein
MEASPPPIQPRPLGHAVSSLSSIALTRHDNYVEYSECSKQIKMLEKRQNKSLRKVESIREMRKKHESER